MLSEISNFVGAILNDFLLLVNLLLNLVEELIFNHISEVLKAIVIFTFAWLDDFKSWSFHSGKFRAVKGCKRVLFFDSVQFRVCLSFVAQERVCEAILVVYFFCIDWTRLWLKVLGRTSIGKKLSFISFSMVRFGNRRDRAVADWLAIELIRLLDY